MATFAVLILAKQDPCPKNHQEPERITRIGNEKGRPSVRQGAAGGTAGDNDKPQDHGVVNSISFVRHSDGLSLGDCGKRSGRSVMMPSTPHVR